MTMALLQNTLVVRPRGPQDDTGLFALFNEVRFLHDASTREAFQSCEEMRSWLDGVVASQRFELVALIGTELVGFGGLYVLGDGQSHSGFLALGVRDAYQGQGIGTIVMHMLVATGQIYVGLRRLQLTVFSDNAAAISLYRKFGFEIEGRHRSFARRGADFVDAFTMARLFGENEAAEPDVKGLQRTRHSRALWSTNRGGRWIVAA
jgi:putative acetyltransferase